MRNHPKIVIKITYDLQGRFDPMTTTLSRELFVTFVKNNLAVALRLYHLYWFYSFSHIDLHVDCTKLIFSLSQRTLDKLSAPLWSLYITIPVIPNVILILSSHHEVRLIPGIFDKRLFIFLMGSIVYLSSWRILFL